MGEERVVLGFPDREEERGFLRPGAAAVLGELRAHHAAGRALAVTLLVTSAQWGGLVGCGARGRQLCLRRRLKCWPGAVPRLPHYASGRAGAGQATWRAASRPRSRCGWCRAGLGEPSVRAWPGSEGRRAGRAAALPDVGGVRCAVLCLGSALKKQQWCCWLVV